MLVSHRYNFIYTKTAKTGGTSVESYFERFCMSDDEWTLSHGRDEYASQFGIVGFRGATKPKNCTYWNHMPAALIKEKVGKEVWDKYFKFCVIRNPYDKVISAFYHMQRANYPSIDLLDVNDERSKFGKWLLHNNLTILNDKDFCVIDGKFCLDDVVRYETLAPELERICVRLGIPWEPATLPTYKAGFRPKNAKVVDLYTEESKKIVEVAFAFELEYFKYKFPA